MKEVLILKILCDGAIHSVKEIANKLEVCEATVKRKIACLRDVGVNIITKKGKNGGCILSNKERIW